MIYFAEETMTKKLMVILAMIFLLGTQTQKSMAQTSHTSGFYPDVDSLFFTVDWTLKSNEQIQWSINSFTEDSWEPYTDGVWLKERPEMENTWEQKTYGACATNSYPSSSDSMSGPRKKFNVIRVRLVNIQTNKVVKDSVYTIGLGMYPHIGYHSFFLTVDLSEFDVMMTNFDDDIRIRAWATIFSPNGTVESSQPVQFYIAAGSSACIANKGFSIKAENEAPISGPKNMTTSVFSDGGSIQKVKKVKLRSGNGGQAYSFGIHEITQSILDYPGVTIGGAKSNVGLIYINGSYWSLTFPQQQPDNERIIAERWNTDKDSIDVIIPINFNIYIDTFYTGYRNDTLGTFIYFNFDFDQDPRLMEIYNALGFSEVTFIPGDLFAEVPPLMVRNSEGVTNVVANAEEGTIGRFQPIAQRLTEMINDSTTNYFTELQQLLDLDNWLRYLIVLNYFDVDDAITNNAAIILSDNHKSALVQTDWDNVAVWTSLTADNWESKIFHDTYQYDNGFLYQIIRMLLRFPETQERLILLYQDMINQVFDTARVLPMLHEQIYQVMQLYPYHHNAWGGYPNGGQDSLGVLYMYDRYEHFLRERPITSLDILMRYFQGADSLELPRDLHSVSVVFDSIPTGSASVILNKDTIMHLSENFSGLYLKKPAITIDVVSDIPMYIKEYPDSGLHFSVFPDSVITITLMQKGIVPTQVVLKEFSCDVFDINTNLYWTTDSEYQNVYFTVQYSLDSLDWNDIGNINSTGTEGAEYYFTTSFLNGYYRLKYVGNDGAIGYSFVTQCSVVSSNHLNQKSNKIIFPNPTKGMLYFTTDQRITDDTAVVVSMSGKSYFVPIHNNSIDVSFLPSGVYILYIDEEGVKFIKQ